MTKGEFKMNIDKEISEMAGRIAEQTEEILEAKDKQIAVCQHEIICLEKEKNILHKALELLIENIELESCYYCPCGNRGCCEGSGKDCFEYIKDYFIQQAKESLK